MTDGLGRATIFPEPALPDFDGLIAEGRKLAETVRVGPCPFLDEYSAARSALVGALARGPRTSAGALAR